MPVEIKELHIKVNVNQPQEQGSAAAAGSSDGMNENDKDALSSLLLDQLLEIIKNKDER